MRGKVTFSAGNTEYCLQFTTNRLCDLEEATQRPVTEFVGLLGAEGTINFLDLRTLFQAGLWPARSLSETGDLIDEIGMTKVAELVIKAFEAAFNIKADGAGGGATSAGKKMAGAA